MTQPSRLRSLCLIAGSTAVFIAACSGQHDAFPDLMREPVDGVPNATAAPTTAASPATPAEQPREFKTTREALNCAEGHGKCVETCIGHVDLAAAGRRVDPCVDKITACDQSSNPKKCLEDASKCLESPGNNDEVKELQTCFAKCDSDLAGCSSSPLVAYSDDDAGTAVRKNDGGTDDGGIIEDPRARAQDVLDDLRTCLEGEVPCVRLCGDEWRTCISKPNSSGTVSPLQACANAVKPFLECLRAAHGHGSAIIACKDELVRACVRPVLENKCVKEATFCFNGCKKQAVDCIQDAIHPDE